MTDKLQAENDCDILKTDLIKSTFTKQYVL